MTVRTTLIAIVLLSSFGRAQNAFPSLDSLMHGAADPVSNYFPDASVIDYSSLLEPPAGRRGFVSADDNGHLRFQDERRARFWGIAIDQESVTIPKEMIDRILNVLARGGVNIIRFPNIDDRIGREGQVVQNIIDERSWMQRSSAMLDNAFQDRLDYWIAAAKKRGIYSLLVFRSSRRFRSGDGVANADSLEPGGGAPAIFDGHLIGLQKNFIDSLFTNHRNPYTGLTYINEPAIAAVEIGTDAGLLSRSSDWSSMPEPYWSQFNRLWNEWLKDRYRSTARLRAAWTNAAGIQTLRSSESLEQGTVRLPNMDESPFGQAILAPYHDALRSPARRSDAVRFALFLEQRYFESMKDFCRERGIRVPLVAGIRNDEIPSMQVVSQTLGATSAALPIDPAATDRQGRTTVSGTNPLSESGSAGIAPMLARTHWAGKPVVLNEWSVPWPNPFRVTGPFDVAAACLFQGVDVAICTEYQTKGTLMAISPSGIQSDPVRWGLFGMAATMFLQGDVRPAERTVAIRYSEDDLATFSSYSPDLYSLAGRYRVVNVFEDEEEGETPDLTVTSGRSHTDEVDMERVILYSQSPYVEPLKQQVVHARNSLYAKAGYAIPITVFRSDSFAVRLDTSTVWLRARYGFKTNDVRAKGLVPFGVDPAGRLSLGFLDSTKQVLGLGSVAEKDVPLIAGEMMNRWRGKSTQPAGEIVRDVQQGVAAIRTPRFSAVYGSLVPGHVYEAGALRVSSRSPVAAIAAVSLDGQPLEQSARIAIKMATVAGNTGQVAGTTGKKMVVRSPGTYPVRTDGRPSKEPTTVWIGGRKLVDVFMTDGTWELVVDRSKKEIDYFCDTPLANVSILPDTSISTVNMGIVGSVGEEPEWSEGRLAFSYPPYAAFVRILLP